jgi:type VI secretion system secreted protein VgrG
VLVAKKELLLTSGGAYIRLKDGNIEIHGPGTIDVKGAQHGFSGPVKLDEKFPAWTGSEGARSVDFSA